MIFMDGFLDSRKADPRMRRDDRPPISPGTVTYSTYGDDNPATMRGRIDELHQATQQYSISQTYVNSSVVMAEMRRTADNPVGIDRTPAKYSPQAT
ncbi:hypothetical protein [Sphingomonas prati]|uniref:hypothetical protein n=1 Tax=Sphingomonas prati TaxID=1843237 RepID=UPI00166E66F8|nr:hypothetical protein [Sphingomonas prati]